LVAVDDVTKYYGPNLGISHISFRVEKGEVLGLLGPNGAGKTTTLRILTGFMPATEGHVTVDGHDMWDEPYEVRRRIGYLPDNPPLYPEMTVRAYLLFMAELRGVRRERRRGRADEVIERLSLNGVAGRMIGHLSRGYRQRVGLAQAIVHEPPVIVMDEPTVGLDPRQIAEMRELVRGLGRDHAVVLSSHILPEVRAVCQRVLILHRGRVLAEDSPDGLARHLQGTRRLAVRARAPREELERTLLALEGVVHVASEEEGPEPLFQVEAEPDRDVREPLFHALAGAGWPILELRPSDASLEEVFLQLTTEEGKAASR
jgi:ABC-2 type transport system ATP-binding protein